MEKSDVQKEASLKNEETDFGELMSLCFLKGAELDVKQQKYTGRVVFRGDKVKDQHDYLGTSASHMAASNSSGQNA
eukprot:2658880-Karenia_brevis.AAC.1